MGDSKRQFRKLELNDASTSEPCDAPDSSIADSADSQYFDDQAVLDVLESGPCPMLNQSVGDSEDEIDLTDTLDETDMFVPYEELSDRLKQLEEITQRQRAIEDPETFGAISDTNTYPLVRTRVSWKQRVLGWFRRS